MFGYVLVHGYSSYSISGQRLDWLVTSGRISLPRKRWRILKQHESHDLAGVTNPHQVSPCQIWDQIDLPLALQSPRQRSSLSPICFVRYLFSHTAPRWAEVSHLSVASDATMLPVIVDELVWPLDTAKEALIFLDGGVAAGTW